jgi:hypothetical protein
MRDYGMFLSTEQQKAQIRLCDQSGMRFELTCKLPRDIKRTWLCEVLGVSPRSTRRDNVDVVWVKVIQETFENLPDGLSASPIPFDLTMDKVEVFQACGIAITE